MGRVRAGTNRTLAYGKNPCTLIALGPQGACRHDDAGRIALSAVSVDALHDSMRISEILD